MDTALILLVGLGGPLFWLWFVRSWENSCAILAEERSQERIEKILQEHQELIERMRQPYYPD